MASKELECLRRKRASCLAQLSNTYEELERQMITRENVSTVSTLYEKLCDRFKSFKCAHLECLDNCVASDEVEDLKACYDASQRNFAEFQERYTQWTTDEISPDEYDSRSLGNSVHTSSSSVSSSKSRLALAKLKRLKAERKLKKINEIHAIEQAKQDLDRKAQILEQRAEIEEAELEERLWRDVVGEENGDTSGGADDTSPPVLIPYETGNMPPTVQTSNRMVDKSSTVHTYGRTENFPLSGRPSTGTGNSHIMRGTYRPEDNVDATSGGGGDDFRRVPGAAGIPTVGNVVTNIDLAFQKLASTLHEGFNLPKPELFTFSGKPTEYSKFVKNFETNIESKVSDDRLRLSYLIQYCEGEAKVCIEDCVLLEPCEGYKRARSILYSRYGRPHLIARAYIDHLVIGPPLKASDIDELQTLSLEMQKCEITLSQLGFASDVDNSENLRQIVRRLPMHMRTKWVDVAHNISVRGREPRFSDLAKFVEERSSVASSMYGIDLVKEGGCRTDVKHSDHRVSRQTHVANRPKTRVTTLTTHSESTQKPLRKCCCCCSGSCDDLSSCSKFQNMTLTKRREFVNRAKLCFNCLKGKHFANTCRKPNACSVNNCRQKHHFLLHKWVNSETGQTATDTSVNCAAIQGSVIKNCLGIIPVVVKGENGNTCQAYALLDDGADKTLCDERLLRKLNVNSKAITFAMSTACSTGTLHQGYEVDLEIRPVAGDSVVNLRKVWSVKKLPISTKSAAVNVDLHRFPYLAGIDMPQIDTDDVMLLIGTDTPDAHIPLEVLSGSSDEPYAVRSRLGWAVRGPVNSEKVPVSVNVNFQQSSDVVLQQQLERMWTTDFCDKSRDSEQAMSVEDRRALQIMESSITHKDGHYKLGLPWRDSDVTLPNNIVLAQVRLSHLKRKLSRDHDLHRMYTTAIEDYVEKGYAEEVKTDCTDSNRIWYLPHHPVINVNKPGKVRVVFDCAAKYKGVSLNSQLMQGPDFMNSLVGVLIRFRQDHVAIAADVEAMFHQVRVLEEDTDALRYLWWPGGDMSQPPKCYKMKVHLFGATSSPSCTGYALKRTAADHKDHYTEQVITTVERNFYVDDCLKSVDTECNAIQLANDLRDLLQKGGFRLTKWLSNSRQVIETIPQQERARSVLSLSPNDNLPCDRALGVTWDVNDDQIKFKVKLADKPLTRRGILSIVSSIFDPLGLVAPVLLRAKAVIQDLCRQKLAWDDPIPHKYHTEWRNWLSSLPGLEDVSISRCYKSALTGTIVNTQLHVFCDGSLQGYGACAYLRLTDTHGVVSSTLILGKSRLAPIKQISIPRLELSGAVVACRLYEKIADELEMKVDEVTFWTDSTIVLGYINNQSKRFKTFVGNRLAIIHDVTTPDQWHHVDTKSNPADIASRGINARDADSMNIWLHGPQFLLQDPTSWPALQPPAHIPEDDIEVKKEMTILTTNSDVVDSFFGHFSSWERLKRAVAWLLRFKTFCKHRFLRKAEECESGYITAEELQKAETVILQTVQQSHYEGELNLLKRSKPVKKSSSITSLNPVYDNGLLKVKGRLPGKQLEQLPIILPARHHVTSIIIHHYHDKLGHAGPLQVLSSTRERYWIVKGPSTVKRTIGSCVICKRYHGALCQQQMAPLRKEQITPDNPPFTYVGVDYFGPLIVKIGRSHAKRYGCIFTCLNTRAVHFEVAHSLTTSSFISAFRRFTSRRGTPEKIFSDNGTNLVSGDRELRKAIQEWNQSTIGRHMASSEIEWHFNPPHASNMGGAWERLIRTTRSILKALSKEQLLTDEQLLTLMTEAEKIINDRPITPVSNDPRDPPALTPSMLLLMKSNTSLPQGIFSKEDNYSKRWWKQIQYMANVFWRRWLREYLPMLQTRQKWQRQTTNLRPGDVVLVSDEKSPRGQWPLGRVLDVSLGRDGLVRSCLVKTRVSKLVKPITKLCLLETSE